MAVETPLDKVHLPTFGLSVGVSAIIIIVVGLVLWHVLRGGKA